MVTLLISILLAQATGTPPPDDSRPVVPAAALPQPSEWRFTIEPFLWIPTLAGEGSADDSDDVDVDTGWDDVFGGLDAGFLLAVEARAPDDAYALLADGLFVRFKDDDGSVRSETEVWMIEGGVAVPIARSGVEATAGLRYVGLGLDLDVGPLDVSGTHGWIDPWIGARWSPELGGGFELLLRGDVGGFGVGSDFTWQALAALRIDFFDHWAFDVGYRALSVDFDDDDMSFDALAHGPMIGLSFSW